MVHIYHYSEGNIRVTPLSVRCIHGGLRPCAVRKGLVRSTQKSCYFVRRSQNLHISCAVIKTIFDKHVIWSPNTRIFRACFAREYFGNFTLIILKHRLFTILNSQKYIEHTQKLTLARIIMPVHATSISFKFS